METANFLSVEQSYRNFLFVQHPCHDDASTLRRHSMPVSPFKLSLSSNDVRNGSTDDVLRRVRSFRTTNKGIVNSGDIYRKRSSAGSVVSSGWKVVQGSDAGDSDTSSDSVRRGRLPSTTSQDSWAENSCCSSGAPSYYRVLVLGSSGVGKSALVKLFMSSDGSYCAEDPNAVEGSVSVVLDAEESYLEFCNYPDEQYPEEDINVDAYVVVFSITDPSTFDYAVKLLKYLRNVICTDRSILVVANKSDLVRNRNVDKSNARLIASYYSCKYVETSASLNHNVDDLLVGILSQIRLKLNPDKLLEHMERLGGKRSKNRNGSLKTAKSIINKLLNRQKSLSCDNLYDL